MLDVCMQKWFTLAIVLQLLVSCSSQRSGSENGDTTGGVAPKRVDGEFASLERLPGSSTEQSLAEVISRYLPGRKPRDLKETDYLEASEQALTKLDFDGAHILSNEAVRLAPYDPKAYFMRGRARLDSTNSDADETIADLEKSIALNYKDSKAYEYLALAYDSRSQREKAIDSINKALTINPRDSGLYKLKAALHAAYGDKQSARADYDAWIKVAPVHPLPYALRGQLLESMNEFELALDDYKKTCALPEIPTSVSNRDLIFRLRANLLSRLGRHKEAIAVLNEALSQRSAEDDLLRMRGDQYMLLKDFQKAIDDYTTSINNAPDFAGKAFEARGKAYAATGDKERARKDFQKAKELFERPAEKPI